MQAFYALVSGKASGISSLSLAVGSIEEFELYGQDEATLNASVTFYERNISDTDVCVFLHSNIVDGSSQVVQIAINPPSLLRSQRYAEHECGLELHPYIA